MQNLLTFVLEVSLAIHILMIAVCAWRVWRGENAIDRLIGADLLSTLILAILVLVALILANSIYLDVALGLTVLSFIGTISLAKYIVNQSVF